MNFCHGSLHRIKFKLITFKYASSCWLKHLADEFMSWYSSQNQLERNIVTQLQASFFHLHELHNQLLQHNLKAYMKCQNGSQQLQRILTLFLISAFKKRIRRSLSNLSVVYKKKLNTTEVWSKVQLKLNRNEARSTFWLEKQFNTRVCPQQTLLARNFKLLEMCVCKVYQLLHFKYILKLK